MFLSYVKNFCEQLKLFQYIDFQYLGMGTKLEKSSKSDPKTNLISSYGTE